MIDSVTEQKDSPSPPPHVPEVNEYYATQDLFKVYTWANTHYPSLNDGIVIELGNHFIQEVTQGRLASDDISSIHLSPNQLAELTQHANKLHGAHNVEYKVLENRILVLWHSFMNKIAQSFSLAGINLHNPQRLASAIQILNRVSEFLHSPEGLELAREYREKVKYVRRGVENEEYHKMKQTRNLFRTRLREVIYENTNSFDNEVIYLLFNELFSEWEREQ